MTTESNIKTNENLTIKNNENSNIKNNENEQKTELSKSEILKKSKKDIFKLYEMKWSSKVNNKRPLLDSEKEILNKLYDDEKLNQMQFADVLLQSQIGLVTENDVKNRASKRRYKRMYVSFVKEMVSTLNIFMIKSYEKAIKNS